jgi:hypothetical protein
MKTRIIQTKLWEDEFIGELEANHKFLFLFLITNPLIGLTGAYECTERKIAFDTGLSIDVIREGKKALSEKFIFWKSWIIIKNALKFNNYAASDQQKVAYMNEYDMLPEFVKKHVIFFNENNESEYKIDRIIDYDSSSDNIDHHFEE